MLTRQSALLGAYHTQYASSSSPSYIHHQYTTAFSIFFKKRVLFICVERHEKVTWVRACTKRNWNEKKHFYLRNFAGIVQWELMQLQMQCVKKWNEIKAATLTHDERWALNTLIGFNIQLWACEKWNRERAYEMSSALIIDGIACFRSWNAICLPHVASAHAWLFCFWIRAAQNACRNQIGTRLMAIGARKWNWRMGCMADGSVLNSVSLSRRVAGRELAKWNLFTHFFHLHKSLSRPSRIIAQCGYNVYEVRHNNLINYGIFRMGPGSATAANQTCFGTSTIHERVRSASHSIIIWKSKLYFR